MIGRRLIAALLAIGCSTAATAREGFLDVRGKEIVDGTGKPVILRAMGLGGWMLQEGYMLNLGELGQQHVIHRKLAALAGQDAVDQFQQAWLDNHMTRADMDALGRWGFNAVRLPMHQALFLDTDAPAGQDRWREDGFRRVDRLLEWAAANRMWVILDLHAAPGGQGTDLAISDRDPSKPSLWDSAENQRRTVALWRELARRYANNPWVGGYDILNEPNWDFDGPGGGHGCEDKRNAPITALYKKITTAIREHDRDHLIVIEGNCWGNNYAGIMPDWDGKLVLSFHKYWNRNDNASIDGILKLREATGRPIWLGESGENSNAWYRDAIKLVERHKIGWAWWPLKKLGFNNPLEVVPNPGWKRVVAYLTGKGPKPTASEARAAMLTLANHDIAYANNIVHPDVIDAMFRQPHDDRAIAFKPHRLRAAPLTIAAVDYDLGPPGVAYFDKVDANYHVTTGGERVEWNDGRTYRNDGVDIARDEAGQPYVTAFEAGEWMQYTVKADRQAERTVSLDLGSEAPAELTVNIGGGTTLRLNVEATTGWQTLTLPPTLFQRGDNRLKLAVVRGRLQLRTISVR
ncbi:cellulase family glycosylhydrolase [Sphingomonas flavescens]|uniref:cellulase family glycosylhydrolase n=1 Tax=Sphingomonas flavescens TaxID=3132797 RepID=UPI002803F1B4|nr:cellulase family glycosylhydrolase [Sphingomonas limnosediminicola]